MSTFTPGVAGTPVPPTPSLHKTVPPAVPALPEPWKHISHGHDEAIKQMEGRRDGTIRSIKTPWSQINDVGMAGLEFGTTIIVGARPGVGKTLFAGLITNSAPKLNADQDFAILDFQFEMLAKNMGMREISHHLGKSIKYLNSAEPMAGTSFTKLVDIKDLEEAKRFVNSQRSRKHYVVESSMDPLAIEKTVIRFYAKYGIPMICTIDHSMLTQRCPTDKDAQDMLHTLGKMCTRTKRKMPIIWIVLSQLNREIDSAVRQEKPGSPNNYPIDSDLFGGDALLHHADMVALMNRPAKYNQGIYGPGRYLVGPNLIAMHWTKVRSGAPCIVIFEADFAKSTMHQVDSPKIAPSTRGAGPAFGPSV